MGETKTVTLKNPVALGSETYDRLDLKEPIAAQVVKAQTERGLNGSLAATIVLIAEVSGVPKPAVERMEISAIREADRFLAGFMEEPEKTGSTSWPS